VTSTNAKPEPGGTVAEALEALTADLTARPAAGSAPSGLSAAVLRALLDGDHARAPVLDRLEAGLARAGVASDLDRRARALFASEAAAGLVVALDRAAYPTLAALTEQPPLDRHAATASVAVYGTLRRGERNHALLAAADRAAWLGRARVAGPVFVAPASRRWAYPYPGLGLAGGGHATTVEVYRVLDPTLWAELDELEDFDRRTLRGSYLRTVAWLHRRDAAGGQPGDCPPACWVYRYNLEPAERSRWIASGDWLDRPAEAGAAD
ncbi:MAG: gamma-glutamylcyclotransferase, partial [Acidimicrobiia bacterium]|nr:gamma-glutamylcyclotransferase [Acidimicrobiia bacterium]